MGETDWHRLARTGDGVYGGWFGYVILWFERRQALGDAIFCVSTGAEDLTVLEYF